MAITLRAALAASVLLAASSAHAISYKLPTSTERPYSKLTDAGVTVCATWVDGGVCDVPAGTYWLHRFDQGWSDKASQVTVGAPADDDPQGSVVDILMFSETCERTTSCEAFCEVGEAVGGTCEAIDFNGSASLIRQNSTGLDNHVCDLDEFEPETTFRVQVTCVVRR